MGTVVLEEHAAPICKSEDSEIDVIIHTFVCAHAEVIMKPKERE